MPTLRNIVKNATGQDVQHCQACLDCETSCPEELDVPLGSLVQMVIFNDEEVLTSRTLWSDCVLENARYACRRGLNLQILMLALREEAKRRGLV
ncbi:MAG: hypothetical protein ACOYYJ_09265 [Chloroflexota bacterium]